MLEYFLAHTISLTVIFLIYASSCTRMRVCFVTLDLCLNPHSMILNKVVIKFYAFYLIDFATCVNVSFIQ